MAPKLFITGVTGFIGGDFLYLVSEKHPDWQITALVRNTDKGAKVAAQYPKVRLVYGDLSSSELISTESSHADIVYHFANCDDIPSAHAIAKGLSNRQSSLPDRKPGYWIHTCGTSILSGETRTKEAWGDELPKIFNDWDGIGELTSLPHDAPHRDVDEIVLASFTPLSSADGGKSIIEHGLSPIRTAIVCPPTIYGRGRGPDNQKSIQIPKAIDSFFQLGHGYKIGRGENVWHQVHVQDLSKLYLLLGEAAVKSPDTGAPATWNEQGYYLVENNHPFTWGEIMSQITAEAHRAGYLDDATVKSLSMDEVLKTTGPAGKSLATNSRGTAIRAAKLLGWEATMPTLQETIQDTVENQARLRGLKPGHRDVVAAEAS